MPLEQLQRINLEYAALLEEYRAAVAAQEKAALTDRMSDLLEEAIRLLRESHKE